MRPLATPVALATVALTALLAGCTAGTAEDSSPAPSASALDTATPAPETPAVEPTPTSVAPTPVTPPPASTPTEEPAGPASVSPRIVAIDKDAGLDELRVTATIPGVLEEGGSCVLILTRGAAEVELAQEAVLNVDRTECAGVAVRMSDLADGTWQAVMSYASATSQGSSKPEDVTIP